MTNLNKNIPLKWNAALKKRHLARTRDRMGEFFTSNQVLGRSQTIGCTAVEITQRCNLDCALCYLSDNSESVKDIPIEVVYGRLDEIIDHYGPGTHIQITGGDPTLRKHDELIAIVAYARSIGLYPALFTNGIAASRKLLTQLANVGLCDVAFHVDTSQRRCGYDNELSLNTLRLEYMDRVRGLDLMVIFNTTIHEGNIDDIPMLVDFFASHTDVVGFSSFQLQAETGRGDWGSRDKIVSHNTVRRQIEVAAGRKLPWDVIQIGHRKCHSYMPLFVVGKGIYPVIEDQELFESFLNDFSSVKENRHSPVLKLCLDYAKIALRKPQWWLKSLKYLSGMVWKIRSDMLRSGGRVRKLSLFIHDFMDASNLDPERVDACSFMLMTHEGPVSMCAHNARRDDYILSPITITRKDGSVINFQPLQN